MKYSQLKVARTTKPKTTQNLDQLCNSAEVDLVLLASNHAFHASEAILALKANEHVLIEKPIALTLQDTDRIIAADQAAGSLKVFVGYMRRYAAVFIDAVKEVDSIGEIGYARARDLIGPNSIFIGQSITFPQTFNDCREEDKEALHQKALQVELGVITTQERKTMWDYLSMLGSHDLSAMREIIGMPTGVIGFSPCATPGSPFWR